MPSIPHDDLMRKYLAKPEDAVAYLNTCIEDGNPWLIADAFRLVEQIHGKKQHFRLRIEPTPRRAASKPRTVAPKRTRKVAA